MNECMDGCDTTPRDPATELTAGQLLHRLHTIGKDDQLDLARRMLDALRESSSCFVFDHAGRLARDDEERLLLLWLHAEAAWQRDQLDDDALKWTGIAGRHAEEMTELADERDMLRHRLAVAERENERLQRHLEFEIYGGHGVYDGAGIRDNLRFPLCACATPEQLAALDPKLAPPQCSVHTDGCEKGDRCPGCGGPASENVFDREVCPEPCGEMHTRCKGCGTALGGCPVEAPGVLPEGGTQ